MARYLVGTKAIVDREEARLSVIRCTIPEVLDGVVQETKITQRWAIPFLLNDGRWTIPAMDDTDYPADVIVLDAIDDLLIVFEEVSEDEVPPETTF